jgi:hypothetical protein
MSCLRVSGDKKGVKVQGISQELIYVTGIQWKKLSLLDVVQFAGVNVWGFSNTHNSIIMKNRAYVDHTDIVNYVLQ